MIVRMLHYKIKPGKLDEYLSLFAGVKERVAGMEGINFFELFRDLEDPNTLFLVAVFEDSLDLDKYNEVGPNKEYNEAVMPLIDGFDLAMVYEVSAANPLPFAALFSPRSSAPLTNQPASSDPSRALLCIGAGAEGAGS
jgi:quinol monooxygenase YgiN